MSLLEVCKRIRHFCNVVLFSDGPFRQILQDANVDVTVSSPRGFSNLHKQGGRTLPAGALRGVVKLAWEVIRLARSHRLIYANTQKAMVIGALAGAFSHRPVVWHLRDIVSPDHFDPNKLRVIKWLSKSMITHVIANSQASAKALQDLAGLPPDRISVIYNGIDAGPFDAAAKIPVAVLRRRYGLPTEAFLVGAFSRLAKWKGQHVLLEAIANKPGVHAVLVGAALFGEDEYEAQLREQVKTLGIEDRVHFLGFQSDIPGLMRAMDIVAHTSIASEPFGRVIVEAMLARRPIIATAAGGALEIITDQVDGSFVEPGNVRDLSSKIDMLRENLDMVAELVVRAYATACANFNPDVYCQAVVKQLESVGGFNLATNCVDSMAMSRA
ncbi:glycosyltransferase family 4 protein [Robbsia sp. Bb-Pol-6]|uniref:Glycosyltransferase family 4 protein n=1 Tax=Robbsia betulipollinis TaxID=2981849 RepID=A0ABT3ZUA6_9BURK|nr:glycosyltransferase family 4 protein [Robbsia betulipollinis]MCY0389805.1 glycosyltransferase family 4 protein [Robbsia betulipollinis]